MIDLNHVHAKIEEDMTDVGKVTIPKEAKGGTFAPADVPLIKRALEHYLRLDISDSELNHVANLLHRLNNRI
jgi:hypothetical protein